MPTSTAVFRWPLSPSTDHRVALFLIIGSLATPLAGLRAGAIETWRQENAAAFGRGRLDRVVVSDSGTIRLARNVRPLGKFQAAQVWDLARGADGTIYAATSTPGRVLRLDAGTESWSDRARIARFTGSFSGDAT